MAEASERTPLLGVTASDAASTDTQMMDVPSLEVRANELLRAGEAGINAPFDSDTDVTHELASVLYALHIVERHDRARGSARAAAYRANETLRTRVALRHRAVAALDAALAYCGTEGHMLRDEDDDDVLVLTRPLPVSVNNCTTGE
jgi:hypothetical protein